MTIEARAIRKAMKSDCKYRISAVGLDHKGDLISISHNKHRFSHEGGSYHAEMLLMARYGKNLKTIIIYRVNKLGDLLPIAPCRACANKAEELGIKIISPKAA